MSRSFWRRKFFFYYDDELGGQLTKKTMTCSGSESTKATYYYDADRNLVSRTDALGRRAIWNQYDQYGRVTRGTYPADNYSVSGYDKVGKITQRTSYDSSDTAVSESRLAYDPTGRITSRRRLVNPGGGTSDSDELVEMAYDKCDRIITRTTYLTTSDTKVETYVYDTGGRVITQTLSDGPTVAKSYDGGGHVLTKVVDPGSGKLELTTTYEYDGKGNATRVTNPDNTYKVDLYDCRGRATKELRYDASG